MPVAPGSTTVGTGVSKTGAPAGASAPVVAPGPTRVPDLGFDVLTCPDDRAMAMRVGDVGAAKVGSGAGTATVGVGPGVLRTSAMIGPTGALCPWRSKAVTVYA